MTRLLLTALLACAFVFQHEMTDHLVEAFERDRKAAHVVALRPRKATF